MINTTDMNPKVLCAFAEGRVDRSTWESYTFQYYLDEWGLPRDSVLRTFNALCREGILGDWDGNATGTMKITDLHGWDWVMKWAGASGTQEEFGYVGGGPAIPLDSELW